MFGNRSEENDEAIAENLVDFSDALGYRYMAIRFVKIFLVLNGLIWLAAIIFPNFAIFLFERLGGIGGKVSMAMLIFPGIFGFTLFYSLIRLTLPDVEENKMLDSELMGSVNYQSSASRRYLVWIGAILGGFFNSMLLGIMCLFLNNNGLYLFSF